MGLLDPKEKKWEASADHHLTEYSTSERSSCSWSGSRDAILPPLEEMAAVQMPVDSPSEMQSRTSLRLSDVCSLIFLLQSLSL
jgi:hypothetical protein